MIKHLKFVVLLVTFVGSNTLLASAETEINFINTAQKFQAWSTNTNILASTFESMCYLRPAFCASATFPALKARYYDYLFKPGVGVGFNGVRAFANPGQDPVKLATYVDGSGRFTARFFNLKTPAWLNEDGSWSPTNPAAIQMEILAAAKARGANTFTLRAQGAPWWMTIARDGGGNSVTAGAPNLDPANYRAYANYAVGVAKRLGNAGFPIQSISLFEETQSPPRLDEDGDFYGPNDYLPVYHNGELRQPLLVKELAASIKSARIPALVSVANEASPRATWRDHLSKYPVNFHQYIGIVGTHGYTARPDEVEGFAPLRNFADSIGKDIEVTEDDRGTPGDDPAVRNLWPGQVRMVKKIAMQLNVLGIKRWTLWNPGRRLLWFDVANNQLEFMPQYYALKFLTDTIPAESTILRQDNQDLIAAIFRKGTKNNLRLVIVNWSDTPQTHTLVFPNLTDKAVYTKSLITEATMTSPATSTGRLSGKRVVITLPASSMVSLVFDAEDKGNLRILKDRVNDMIIARRQLLTRLLEKVNARSENKSLRGTTESRTSINQASTRLADFGVRLLATNDRDLLYTLVTQIMNELRVYNLLLPRTNNLLVVDDLDADMVRVESHLPRLSRRTTRAENNGVDVSQARGHLSAIETHKDSVQVQTQLAYDTLFPIVPDYGSSTIKKQNARALTKARGHIKTARQVSSTISTTTKMLTDLLAEWGV